MQKEKNVDCLDHFIQQCKHFDLKITPQRCVIYKKLMKAKTHPTADEMFHIVKKDFQNISYDTVNRTLLTFAEIGLIDVIPTKGGPRRFDPDLARHHHFHCVQCGKIVDITSVEFDNVGIPGYIRDEYMVFTKRVVLNGLCKRCLKKKGSHVSHQGDKNKKINQGELR